MLVTPSSRMTSSSPVHPPKALDPIAPPFTTTRFSVVIPLKADAEANPAPSSSSVSADPWNTLIPNDVRVDGSITFVRFPKP